MNPFEIKQEEFDRLHWHLTLLAIEFDLPDPAAQKVRDAANNLGEKYFTERGELTLSDVPRIRDFIERNGRNPDEAPPLEETRPADDGWVSAEERSPELPVNATRMSVDVRYLDGDELVEQTALFINEQSGINTFGVPSFVLLGGILDILNSNNGNPTIALRIYPTHWRLREA